MSDVAVPGAIVPQVPPRRRKHPVVRALLGAWGMLLLASLLVYFASFFSLLGLDRAVVQFLYSALWFPVLWWEALRALANQGVRKAGFAFCLGLYLLLFGLSSFLLAPLSPPEWVAFVVQFAYIVPLVLLGFGAFRGSFTSLRPHTGTPVPSGPHPRIAMALAVPLLALSVLFVPWAVSMLPEVLPTQTLSTTGEVDALAWSPDGQHLAVMARNGDITTHDGDVTIWNQATWRQELVLPCAAAATGVLAWSADGAYLAANCGDNTVQVWDASGALMKTFLASHEDPQLDASFAWSPSGSELALLVQTEDASRIEVWNIAADARMASFPLADQDQWITWSPDGRFFAVTDESVGTVDVLDAGTARQVEAFKLGEGYSESIAWSPDSTKLLFAGNESFDSSTNIVAVWDVATRRRVVSGTSGAGITPSVSWSPDGSAFAVGSPLLNGMVQVYDTHTGHVVFSWLGQSQTTTAVAWSPDGREIASGTLEGSLVVWQPILPAH